jgi:glycosyltransferase involved in cell wall biosynthesis
MKILFTASSYYPMSDGVQNITAFYAERLAANGHQVIVVTSRYPDMVEEETHNGVLIKRVNMFTKKSIYHGEINEYRELMIKMSSEVDVIVNVCLQTAFTDCILDLVSLFPCKKVLYLHGMAHFHFPNVPTIDMHDIMSWFLNVIRWKSFYNKTFKKLSAYDQIIHLHEKDETYTNCVKYGITQNSIIENGTGMRVDTVPKGDFSDYYICVSNYFHDKNQEFVLRAYYKSNTKKKLIFIGSSETKYYERLIEINNKLQSKKSNMDKKVIFLLNQPRDVTERYINNAFAVLNGSKSEKYPVTICEAIACGIPYISTDVGIVKYLPGGIIVRNTDEMSMKIDYIETDEFDRNYNSEQERKYRDKHQNMDTNYEHFEDILEQC